jgi:FtsP/CotA-like multicopper oxidase with cupredoxin domain
VADHAPLSAQRGFDPTLSSGRLQYQPISSLIKCDAGERVLLRMSNLGYQNHTLSVDNIDLKIVAKDASLLRGRDSTTNYIETNSVDVGPGESRDVIFVAPDQPGSYLLYDRKYSYLSNSGGPGYGGMLTEIRVSAPGTNPPQTVANG